MSGRYVEDPVTGDLKRWVRETDFPDPVRWGEVEAKIRSYPPPPRDELDQWYFKDERVSSALGYLIMAPVALLTFGSPIIGLGLVVGYTQFGWSLPSDWFFLVVLLHVAIVTVPVIPVLYVWTAKKRERWHVVLSGGTLVASGASFVLLQMSDLAGGWSQIVWYVLLSAVLGLCSVVFLLVKVEPRRSRPWRERWRATTPEEKWYQSMRAVVLEQMTKRDLVDQHDTSTMIEMPLGTWQELDGQTSRHR